jgi:molybdopterin synthase sulfur carrier subunit
MARVVLTRGLHEQAPPGTPQEIEIDAHDVRELLRKLELRLPGIQQRVEEGLAMAIDGDIVSDPLLEPVSADSEIHFLPPLQGGR